jgi:hypothetical protein
MEEIQAPTPSQTILKKNLSTDEEEEIIKHKYAAPQIRRIAENIQDWSMILLLKIHVITGWVIPENPLKNILIDQFEKKLLEDYEMLNVREIEYAFRKTGTLIKDWGKEMNLNLIDQVLAPYVDVRLTASANEERRKFSAPPQKLLSDEEIVDERRGQIEQAYQAMRKGYYPLLHDYFLEVLKADGLLKEHEEIEGALRTVKYELLAEFFVRMLNGQALNIYVKE